VYSGDGRGNDAHYTALPRDRCAGCPAGPVRSAWDSEVVSTEPPYLVIASTAVSGVTFAKIRNGAEAPGLSTSWWWVSADRRGVRCCARCAGRRSRKPPARDGVAQRDGGRPGRPARRGLPHSTARDWSFRSCSRRSPRPVRYAAVLGFLTAVTGCSSGSPSADGRLEATAAFSAASLVSRRPGQPAQSCGYLFCRTRAD
jgi:hypothetical protein